MSDMGKDPGYHVGDGGGGKRSAPPRTDFEYGSGGHDPVYQEADFGVHEGVTVAQTWVEQWDADGPAGGMVGNGS